MVDWTHQSPPPWIQRLRMHLREVGGAGRLRGGRRRRGSLELRRRRDQVIQIDWELHESREEIEGRLTVVPVVDGEERRQVVSGKELGAVHGSAEELDWGSVQLWVSSARLREAQRSLTGHA